MSHWLYEYDTGWLFGPASDEQIQEFNLAKASGKDHFLYPYHGYHLRMIVRPRKENISAEEKAEMKDLSSQAYFKILFPR